jgi:hypothetical protein
MFTSVLLLFAGVKEILLHAGIAIAMISLCLLLAYASPVGRKTCLWLAFVVAVFLFGEIVGIHDEKVRSNAQSQIVSSGVSKAVIETETPKERNARDPWDSPAN